MTFFHLLAQPHVETLGTRHAGLRFTRRSGARGKAIALPRVHPAGWDDAFRTRLRNETLLLSLLRPTDLPTVLHRGLLPAACLTPDAASSSPPCARNVTLGVNGTRWPSVALRVRVPHARRVDTLWLEEQLLPHLPAPEGAGAWRRGLWRTCAVVGSSGALLGALAGREIDAHDAVWRVNYAPVAGVAAATGRPFADHVGNRTTVDVVNRPIAHTILTRERAWRSAASPADAAAAQLPPGAPPLLLLSEPIENRGRRDTYLPLLQRDGAGRRVWLLNPEMAHASRYAFHALKQAVEPSVEPRDRPPTGWTAVVAALQVCEQVDVYGFSPYTGAPGERYHYFDDAAAATATHSFSLAWQILQRLAQVEPVRIVARPEPARLRMAGEVDDDAAAAAGEMSHAQLGAAAAAEWAATVY